MAYPKIKQWTVLLVGLLSMLPALAACGGTSQQATTPAEQAEAERIVPVEGLALSGQDQTGREGQPQFLSFDAYG